MILQHRMEAFPVLEIDIKPGSVTEAVSVQVSFENHFLLFNLTSLKPTYLILVTLTQELECSEDRVCISKSNCSYWLEREERYNEGRDDTFISEAREQICNRQQQALCCPKSGE